MSRFMPRSSYAGFSTLMVYTLMTTMSAHAADKHPVWSYPTLDGNPPLVISHRGLSGFYPEETRMAYEKAADAGSDSLEGDLNLTKDCVLVARHNAWLTDNTNVSDAAKTNANVAARKRTTPGVLADVSPALAGKGPKQYLTDLVNPHDPKSVLKAFVVEGEEHVNDWSITDFTMAELRQWVGATTHDARDQRPSEWNGKLPMISFQELIDIRKSKSQELGRAISIYPESKNPYWNNQQGIANGCDVKGTGHPLEDIMLKEIIDNGLNSKDAPIFVQSFDPESLKYLRRIGLKTKVVQLLGGPGIDFKTGQMIYNTGTSATITGGRPYSWTIAGNPQDFGSMLTPAGLAEVKTYADGIGPWKPQVMLHSIQPWPEKNADGKPYQGSLADINTVQPNSVIADAHKAGLFVHVYTFRDEPQYLAGVFKADPTIEYLTYFKAGVDGVFTDFTNTAVAARKLLLSPAKKSRQHHQGRRKGVQH